MNRHRDTPVGRPWRRAFSRSRARSIACAAASAGAQAAPPAPAASLDAILKQVATYDGGIASDALWQMRDYVYARKDDAAGRAECEAKLLPFLKGPATPSGKMAASRLLRVIAATRPSRRLQAMLADPRYCRLRHLRAAAHARRRRRDRAGAVAEDGARRTEGGDRGRPRPAARRDGAAASGAHAQAIRRSPRRPRWRSGGSAGRPRRRRWHPPTRPHRAMPKRLLAASMLEAADGLLAAKETEAAGGLFATLAADRSLPAPMRRAALIGSISAAGPRAEALLVSMLGGDDAEGREAAIARIRDVIPPDGIGRICDLLPRLPEGAQIQVLAALSGYPAARVQARRAQRREERRAGRACGCDPDARVRRRRVDGALPGRDRGHRREGAGAGRGPERPRRHPGPGGRRRHRRVAGAAGVGRHRRRTAEGGRRPAHLPREASRLGLPGGVVAGRAHRRAEDAAGLSDPRPTRLPCWTGS